MAVQEGLTSIRVSWSPPTPLGDTTGYRIYYSGGSSGSEDVSGGSTDNYLLTGLQNGESYTISIVATLQHLPSESVEVIVIGLSKFVSHTVIISFHMLHTDLDRLVMVAVPGRPSVAVTGITATSISLSWSVPSGSVVDSYEVMWQRDTSGECSYEDEGSTTIMNGSTSYDNIIMDREQDSSYFITVKATNYAGSSLVTVPAMTLEAGKSYWSYRIEVNEVFTTSSICCSHFCECI